MRVVSLVPSVTETLRAWGVTPVACTRFCEQPDLATVGGTKNPDLAAISALAPDLVVVDEEENRREDHDALVAAGIPVLALAVRSLADLADQLPRLAAAVGAEPGVLDDIDALGAIDLAAPAAVPAPAGTVPLRAFVPIWRRPWMALGADTYGGSVLAALGVELLPTGAGRYPQVELAAVAALAPDVVLVPSEPYDFREEHVAELVAAFADPPTSAETPTSADRSATPPRSTAPPIVRVDGQDLFWWGTRTPHALDRLSTHLTNFSR